MRALLAIVALLVLIGCSASHEGSGAGAGAGSGNSNVMTFIKLRDAVLVQKCAQCHSEVSSYDSVVSWAKSGVLMSNVPKMPPGSPLEGQYVTMIQAWIDGGMLLQEELPSISEVLPASGPVRTTLTVKGQNLGNLQSVLLGQSPCTVRPGGVSTSFECIAEEREAGVLPLKVVTGSGFTTKESAFTFTDAPVSTVDEENCPGSPTLSTVEKNPLRVVNEGLIRITGSGFKNCSVIEIGDRRCQIRNLISESELDCAPVENFTPNQKNDVTVSNGTSSAIIKNGFTTPVYPNSESVRNFIQGRCATCHTGGGGNPVAIGDYNTNLKNGLIFPGDTSSPLIAKGRDPAHAAAKGTYKIEDYEVRAMERWIGPRQAIQVTSLNFNTIAPNRVAMNLPVRVTTNGGGNYRNGAFVLVGKELGVSQAYNMSGQNISTLSFSTPLRTVPGKEDVTLENGPMVYPNGEKVPGERRKLDLALDYVPAPILNAVVPTELSSKGTNGIVLTGSDFQPGGVTVELLNSANKVETNCGVTQALIDKVTCNMPAIPPGSYFLQLRNNTDLQTVKTAINALAGDPPVIANVAPNTGPSTGKFDITITGSGYFYTGGTLKVDIGGVGCGLNVAKSDDKTIVCTTGINMTPGNAQLTVRNPDGQKASTAFTVVPAPSISSISPSLITNLETILLRVNGNLFATGLTATIGVDKGTQHSCDVVGGSITNAKFDCNTNDVKNGEAKMTAGTNVLTVSLQNGQQTTTNVTVVGAATYAEMRPILAQYCINCHGSMTNNPSGANYDLSTFAGTTASQARVKPNDAAASLLYLRLTNMPPGNGLMNQRPELARVIEAWINGGAPP